MASEHANKIINARLVWFVPPDGHPRHVEVNAVTLDDNGREWCFRILAHKLPQAVVPDSRDAYRSIDLFLTKDDALVAARIKRLDAYLERLKPVLRAGGPEPTPRQLLESILQDEAKALAAILS